MFLSSKTLWRVGPLSKPLTLNVHVRQSGKLLYRQFQEQSRDNSTTRLGRRIYVAGAHHLQTLIANGLAQSSNPKKNPITLMVPSNNHLQHYVDTDGKIQLIQDGVATTLVGAVDIEVLPFPMESSVPEETHPPTKNLRYQRLLLNTGPNEEDFSVNDLPSLLESDPILDVKKRGVRQSRIPISDIKVYDLSFFLELNKSLCDPRKAEKVAKQRVAEIRAPPKESDIAAIPVAQLASINTEPINHLIYGERPGNLIKFFSNIKHRLSPSSAVMVIGNNPGLVEDLYKQVFPDVSQRPNFVECTNGMFMGDTSTEGFWDSPRSVSLLRAQLSVGPLARTVDDGQTPGQVEKREEEIKYLVERVLNTPTLGAVKISRLILERYKLKKLVARSVIYPLTVAYNCMMGEIFSTDERVQEAKLLFEEACAVVQAIDKTLTHQILLNNLLWQVIRAPNIRPLMWKCVEAGYDTNIDLDNGWIIKYGKGMTPTHDKYAKIVKKKASESARTIAANKEESAKAKARLRVAKELAAKRLEEKEKRLELLDAEHMVRRGFKRFVFGETLEVPLSPPDKTYFKPESPIEAPSIWGELKAPRKKIATKEDESNLSAQVEGNGNDSVEKASESSVE